MSYEKLLYLRVRLELLLGLSFLMLIYITTKTDHPIVIALLILTGISLLISSLTFIKIIRFYYTVMRRILGVARTLARYKDLKSTLKFVLTIVADLLNAERAIISLADPEKKELISYLALGLQVKEIKLPVDKGVAGYVFKTATTLNIKDPYKDPRFLSEFDELTGFKTRNILAAPMFDHTGEIMGVLEVLNRRGRRLRRFDEFILKTLAEQIQVVIENSILNEEREKLLESLLKAFAAAIDARDPATKGHSERVLKYALKMAKELNLPEEELKTLEYAVMLHDVGKIGIRDAILLKPSEFTPEEYEIVKKHALYTKEILEKIHFPYRQRDIPLIASSHHEKLDGSGYPFGLQQEKLPLLTRILAITDIYDALVSYDRPYKPPYSQEEALEILKKEAEDGKLDKNLVNVFIEKKIYEIERRKYVRIDADFSIEYRILLPEELKTETTILSTIKDISGVGVRFISNEPIPPNSYLGMKIFIPNYTINVFGKVIHIGKLNGKYRIGVCFLNLSEEDQKKLQDHLVLLKSV